MVSTSRIFVRLFERTQNRLAATGRWMIESVILKMRRLLIKQQWIQFRGYERTSRTATFIYCVFFTTISKDRTYARLASYHQEVYLFNLNPAKSQKVVLQVKFYASQKDLVALYTKSGNSCCKISKIDPKYIYLWLYRICSGAIKLEKTCLKHLLERFSWWWDGPNSLYPM